MKILIVEDDTNINNMVREALIKHGLECRQAFSGTECLMCMKLDSFSLVLLDLMLPGLSGENVLKEIKRNGNTPVIVVSAKDELDTKVNLLTLGAEDYITKPFEIKELIARVDVQLRRSGALQIDNNEIDNRLIHKEIILDKGAHEVRLKEQRLTLTRQEYKILELLLEHPKKVFSKQEIYEYAWDEYYVGEDKTINVHISNLRSKIKQYTDEAYIDTVWGIGFKLS